MPRRKGERMSEVNLSDVLAAIGGIKQSVDGISERLSAVEERVQIQEAIVADQDVTVDKPDGMFGGLQVVGDETGGTLRQKVVGPDGLPRKFKAGIWPNGTKVKLSPDSQVFKLLSDKRDATRFVGTIVGLHFVNDNDVPKYRVHFPGLTTKRGDGFYATELIHT